MSGRETPVDFNSPAGDLFTASPGAEDTVVAVETDDEELVSYLDGEVSPQDAVRIEQRLADDAEFRDRLRNLQQAWDLLDLIPRVDAEESFTRSTVQMIAITAAEEAERARSSRRLRRWLYCAAAGLLVLAGAAGGFWLVRWQLDRPNRQLVADLPLLLDLHLYKQADSTAFLRELEKRRLFDEAPAEGEAKSDPADDNFLARSSDPSVREQALRELPAAELDGLRRRKSSQFDDLEPAEQERLRGLQRQIAAAPQAAKWRELMERYNEWLTTVSSAERAELRDLTGGENADEKAAKIARMINTQEAERFAELLEGRLAKEDLEKISAWLDQFVRDNEKAILAARPDMREQYQDSDDFGRVRMLTLALFHSINSGDRKLPAPRKEQIAKLKDTLSAEARDAWEKASEIERSMLAHKWVGAAFWSKAPPPVSEATLKEFFKSRDAKVREWLERLPPERMAWELRRLYYRDKFQQERRGESGPRPGPGAPGAAPTATPQGRQ